MGKRRDVSIQGATSVEKIGRTKSGLRPKKIKAQKLAKKEARQDRKDTNE